MLKFLQLDSEIGLSKVFSGHSRLGVVEQGVSGLNSTNTCKKKTFLTYNGSQNIVHIFGSRLFAIE